MLKAIIFDCFGVIYPCYTDNYIERHKELFKDSSELLDKLYTQIDLGMISQLDFYAAISKEINIPIEKIKYEMESELVADPNIIGAIIRLKSVYKIGLLSNAGKDEISIIHRDGLAALFDVITVSYEVGDVKPNEKIYRTCLEKLGVDAIESIYIDDSMKNVDAAKSLGMSALHYPVFGSLPDQLIEFASI